MIEAAIRGKLNVAEDVFTSCCIGLLELLPDSYLLEFLNNAVNLDGNQLLSLGLSTSIKSIDFWPGFPSGYPEIVIESESDIIIIEIKHGAHLHGENQLAKYWADGYEKYSKKKIVLIYLTHHRLIPENDLKISEYLTRKKFSQRGNFYWLSWVTLFVCVNDWLLKNPLPTDEKILKLLDRYLTHQGYTCFLGWGDLPNMEKTLLDSKLESFLFLPQGDNLMSPIPTVIANAADVLKIADTFYKKCSSLFEDLRNIIKKECNCNELSHEYNAKHGGFVFKKNNEDNKCYFCFMLLKKDSLLNADYKLVCEKLGIDTKFPLVLVTGKFEPRQLADFNSEFNDKYLHLSWMYHTLMTLGWEDNKVMIEDMAYTKDKLSIINDYGFNISLSLSTKLERDPIDKPPYWWRVNAAFKIRHLTDIIDKTQIELIADELLNPESGDFTIT